MFPMDHRIAAMVRGLAVLVKSHMQDVGDQIIEYTGIHVHLHSRSRCHGNTD
jgi:hypothetical protein